MSNLTHHRALTLGLFCAILTALFFVGYRKETLWTRIGRAPLALLRAEDYVKDSFERLGRKTPRNRDLVFIGIDAQSMNLDGISPEEIAASPALQKMKEGWPWNRSVYGMILDRLLGAGAKAVIFDLLFPTARDGDEKLKDALDRWGDRVVLASNFDFDPSRPDLRNVPSFPSESLLPLGVPHEARVGYVNYFGDADGVIRRTRCQLFLEDFDAGGVDQNSQLQDSLVAATLRQIGRADLIPGPAPVAFRYSGPAGTFQARPAYEMFVPAIWKATNYRNGASLRGKIVIVGPSGGFQQDAHRTPVDKAMPGPEIHLNVLNALLSKEFLTETSLNTDLLLIVLAGLGAWIISVAIRQPAFRFIVLAAVSTGAMALLWYFYNHFGWLTTMSTPLLVFNGAGGVCMVYDFVLERMEKGRFRRTLERYVSKNVVKEILDNPQSYINTLGGMRRPVALLFTDLRGFTRMTEVADSTQFVAQLNEYFTEMVKPVFANDGTLDKFIGDAIMAVWGNVYSRGPAHDVEMAVRTALDMRKGLAQLNEKWRANGIREFAMGIGVNHGVALAGNIGSPEKMDITVIGDAVNLASRIEGLTKKYHLDFLVGEEAATHVRDTFHLQTVDLVQAVGKTKPVRVFAVHGLRSAPLPEPMPSYLEQFEKGIAAYEKRRFDDALAAFEECSRLRPEDYLAELYRGRCAEFLKHAPDESWDGVFVMTEK